MSAESPTRIFLSYEGPADRRWVTKLLRRLQWEADQFDQDLTPRVAHRGWHELLNQAQTQTSALVEQAAASFSSAVIGAPWQGLVDLIQKQISARLEPASASSLTATEPFCKPHDIFFTTTAPSFAVSIGICYQVAHYDSIREFYEMVASSELRLREIFGQHLRTYRRRLRSIYGLAAAKYQRRCALAGGSITRIVHRPRGACRTVTTSSSADDDDASSSFPHHRVLGLDRKGRQCAQQRQITQNHQNPCPPATSGPGRPSMAWYVAGRSRGPALQVLDPACRRSRGSAGRRDAGDPAGSRQIPREPTGVIDQRHLALHPWCAKPIGSRRTLSHGGAR